MENINLTAARFAIYAVAIASPPGHAPFFKNVLIMKIIIFNVSLSHKLVF